MSGKRAGFTYIVLLIWIAVVGATVAAVGPVWHTLQTRDRENELINIGHQFRWALNHYYASNRRFPQRLEDLVRDDHALGVKRYLRKVYFDPMTGQAEWGTIALADGQIVGVHSLSEKEPLKKTGFQPADVDCEDKTKYSEWLFLATVRRVGNAPTTMATQGFAADNTLPTKTTSPLPATPRNSPSPWTRTPIR